MREVGAPAASLRCVADFEVPPRGARHSEPGRDTQEADVRSWSSGGGGGGSAAFKEGGRRPTGIVFKATGVVSAGSARAGVPAAGSARALLGPRETGDILRLRGGAGGRGPGEHPAEY